VRRQSATAHELARVELLAGLPGETLARLGDRMERREIPPGERVVAEGETGDRFFVVLSGLLAAVQSGRGARTLLRPGAYFGEVSLLTEVSRTATVEAITPATVASCDRATFDELVEPLFV
jgi:cAMP-dependent protein kinase regulator